MNQSPNERSSIIELDLTKYGLSHLVGKEIHMWQDDEIDILMYAFVTEDIAPVIYGIPFNPSNVQSAQNLSFCRRCGKCCLRNPNNPDHPGVMVYKEDLRLIADNSKYTYKRLKKNSPITNKPGFPHRRYLPLPCMFYNKKKSVCQIYDIRPLVCSTYPITDLPGQEGICINLKCDYGKDIFKVILDHMRKGTDRNIFI